MHLIGKLLLTLLSDRTVAALQFKFYHIEIQGPFSMEIRERRSPNEVCIPNRIPRAWEQPRANKEEEDIRIISEE